MLRIIFLTVFTLLQMAAPFAHAHVDGHSEDTHAHLPVKAPHAHAEDSVQVQQVMVEHDHTAVVTLPPEHNGKDVPFDVMPADDTTVRMPLLRRLVSRCFCASDSQFPFFTCLPPQSQAPPVPGLT